MSGELKEGKKGKQMEQQQPKAEEPLEETQKEKREGLKLKREAAKLLEEAKGDWKKLGEALYAIYKQDKKKAFKLVGIISRDEKLKKGVTLLELEGNRAYFEECLAHLEINKLNKALDGEEIGKAVLGLAALSGLKEVESEEDVKKVFAIFVLKDAARSYVWDDRYTAAKLIGELGLQKEFKAELMLLMFDGSDNQKWISEKWYKLREFVEDVWKKAGLEDVKVEYMKMTEEEKELVRGLVREAMVNIDESMRIAAAKLIEELELQNEFKPELMLLIFDDLNSVREAAEDAWRKAGYSDVRAEYEAMGEEGKEKMRKKIREYVRRGNQEKALRAIRGLSLEEEFLDILLELAYKEGSGVRNVARKALASWVKEKRQEVEEKAVKIKEGKAHLTNPFSLSEDVKLSEELAVAMSLLCS